MFMELIKVINLKYYITGVIDMYIMDNVECMYCGFDGLVDCGAKVCPKCRFEGALAWKDDELQEVEVNYKEY